MNLEDISKINQAQEKHCMFPLMILYQVSKLVKHRSRKQNGDYGGWGRVGVARNELLINRYKVSVMQGKF